MLWKNQSFPRCTHEVFLSHCREDRRRLVEPLSRALQECGVIAWLDLHDYPHGRPSFAALRDGILRSRHTVFLVTTNMFRQARGWTALELAWATLLQENLQEAGGVLQNVMLPLFFLSKDDRALTQSVWHSAIHDRAVYCGAKGRDRVSWAAQQIRRFVEQEVGLGLDMAQSLEEDPRFRARLKKRPGLIDRITARFPEPAPQP